MRASQDPPKGWHALRHAADPFGRARARAGQGRARESVADAPDTADEHRHVPSAEGTWRWTDHLFFTPHPLFQHRPKSSHPPTPNTTLFLLCLCVREPHPTLWLAAACRNHRRKACYCTVAKRPLHRHAHAAPGGVRLPRRIAVDQPLSVTRDPYPLPPTQRRDCKKAKGEDSKICR